MLHTLLEKRQNLITMLESKHFRLSTKLKEMEERRKESKQAWEETQKEIEKVSAALTGCKAKLKKIKKESEKMERKQERYLFWEEGFGRQGIPSLVLDTTLPEITDCANEYLRRFTDGTTRIDLCATASTKAGHEVDRLTLEVTNTAGGDDYNMNSSGERKVVDFAIMLAIRRFILLRFPQHETSLIVFDEVLDSMDAESSMRLINILQGDAELTAHAKVFIISHREQIISILPETMTIEKRNRQSNIKETQ